jgi:predicted RNA-binding Zn ribbon-like protein
VSPTKPAHSPRDGLRVLEEFLNTRDVRTFGEHGMRDDGRDKLSTPQQLRTWLRARRLIGETERVTRADLDRALALRESLRGALDPNETRRGRTDALLRLRRLAADLPVEVDFDSQARPTLKPQRRGVQAALTSLLAAAIDANISGRWSRLKICAAPDCQWVFVDHSRNRLQRWCATRICGNRMKTRNYRERQRTA